MTNLDVISYNVRGLRNDMKRRKIFNYLHEHKFNVILLQETHSIPDDENFWKAEWGGQIFFSHGTRASRGVAILLNKKLKVNIQKIVIVKDNAGRHISIQFVVDDIGA